MDLKGRDFLTLKDYTPEEILYLIDLAAELKDKKHRGVVEQPLIGKNVALIFEKTSTRTRCSFEVAAHDLGMGTTYLDPTGSQIGKKESIADTARVLSGMYDGIEYRGFDQAIVEELAKYSSVPVFNICISVCSAIIFILLTSSYVNFFKFFLSSFRFSLLLFEDVFVIAVLICLKE